MVFAGILHSSLSFTLASFLAMQATSFLATLLAIFPLSPSAASPHSAARNNVELTTGSASAITPEISALAESLIADYNVPGISVGVVRLNGSSVTTEFGAWGNRTEDGDPADSQVYFQAAFLFTAWLTFVVDDNWSWIVLEGVPDQRDRHPH